MTSSSAEFGVSRRFRASVALEIRPRPACADLNMKHSLPGLNLAGLTILRVQQLGGELTLTACASSAGAACPACGYTSTHLHSRYRRTLRDLPACGTPVRLLLQVRRFRCARLPCPRKTFVEQVAHLTSPHAQQTVRLNTVLALLGLACGGELAARLSSHLHVPTSPDTFLRRVRRLPLPAAPTPRVLGVDDWARRKGVTYGTILCDLERHHPIELLPDRSATTFAAWLRAHPGVEIVCRDRASAYADAVARGAPDALQVADRFHLLKNLTDAVTSILSQHRQELQRSGDPPADAAATAVAHVENSSATTALPETQALVAPVSSSAQVARMTRYTQMVQLRDKGLSQAQIAQQLGVCPRTANRYLSRNRSPEPKRRKAQPSQLDPYLPYLLQRWDEGCHKVVQLWREISAQGYPSGRGLVHQYVSRLRQGERPLQMGRESTTAERPAAPACYPPRQAVWLLLRRPQELNAAEQHDLAAMQSRCPEIATVYRLAQGFTEMVRNRQVERLDEWLGEARASGLGELRSFAQGIERDKAAVVAGLTVSWSSGQVEGQVNRLKLLKRAMYGRAKLDLLHRRVILRL
jgi:transposase